MAKEQSVRAPEIAGYSWVEFLGQGGSADVHRYRQHLPERDVAIKVLRQQAGSRAESMLRREANVLAQVSSHPAIVSLYATGKAANGATWMALEYCALPRWQRGGAALPVAEALRAGVLLSGALATVHAFGIVHRDVKPSNVLMTQFGTPVLTDFGISGTAGLPVRHGEGGLSVPWAAPEVYSPDSIVSPAQDVYSLAATIFTWLAGTSPFEIAGADNSRTALVARVLSSPLPRTGRRDVPVTLEEALARAMSRQPTERPTAADFGRLLQQVQRELELPVTAMDVRILNPGERGGMSMAEADDPDATRARQVPVIEQSTKSASFSFSEHDPSVAASVSRTTGETADGEDSPTPARRRGSWAGIFVAVLAAVLVVGGIGLAFLRGDGWTAGPEDQRPVEAAEPVLATVPGVTDLVVVIEGGEAVASWTAPENPPDVGGALYGYTVERSGSEEHHDITDQTTVRFPSVQGSNCIEIWVRGEGGRTSTPQRACVTG